MRTGMFLVCHEMTMFDTAVFSVRKETKKTQLWMLQDYATSQIFLLENILYL